VWGARALARAQSRDASTPLTNESSLLRCLRKKVGPFADEECLRQHLRAARGKLHWSANAYFREAVTAIVIPCRVGRPRRDFEPKPLARDPKRRHEAADEDEDDALVWERGAPSAGTRADCSTRGVPALPPLAWERVFARVSLVDACRLARVSPETREAAGSETVWRSQYESRWGRVATESLLRRAIQRASFDAAKETENTHRVQWYHEYRARHAREHTMTCPECLTSKVTPIVYGFPSPSLVDAARNGIVNLGGDYLTEGDPNWACRACRSRWRAWPFSWPDRSVVCDAEHEDGTRKDTYFSPKPGTSPGGPRGGGGRFGGGGESGAGESGDLDFPSLARERERSPVSLERAAPP